MVFNSPPPSLPNSPHPPLFPNIAPEGKAEEKKPVGREAVVAAQAAKEAAEAEERSKQLQIVCKQPFGDWEKNLGFWNQTVDVKIINNHNNK